MSTVREVHPDAPPEAETASLRDRLHSHGLRVTPQREMVLAAVDELGHATPDVICAEVQRQAPGVNLSTVYRTLELFEELGLIRHAHFGHTAATYHAATDHAHLHLVCHRCGSVSEADVELAQELVGRLRRTQGFSPDVEHMAISGLCNSCASSS